MSLCLFCVSFCGAGSYSYHPSSQRNLRVLLVLLKILGKVLGSPRCLHSISHARAVQQSVHCCFFWLHACSAPKAVCYACVKQVFKLSALCLVSAPLICSGWFGFQWICPHTSWPVLSCTCKVFVFGVCLSRAASFGRKAAPGTRAWVSFPVWFGRCLSFWFEFHQHPTPLYDHYIDKFMGNLKRFEYQYQLYVTVLIFSGYVKEQREESMVMCEATFQGDSSLECSKYLRYMVHKLHFLEAI